VKWQSSLLDIILDDEPIKKIKEAGAISEETAKTSKELGMGESTLQYLVSVKDVKKDQVRSLLR